jgi:ABC-type multidrug transport system fused ATPase/permease subunit
MNKFKNILKDVLYISRLSGTKNKKILIVSSILLSQLSAGIDLFLIATFASIIADQYTNIEVLNSILLIIDEYRIVVILLVISKYVITYLQAAILKKIEIEVTISLRTYLFGRVLEQKNFSTADSYYYINTLSSHISFFYSNFAEFLNHLLQAIAYLVYLLIADLEVIQFFGIGALVLALPVSKLISMSRRLIHEQFELGRDASKDIVNVIENMSLIKMLQMEQKEKKSFYKLMKKTYGTIYKNFQVTFVNTQLPNLFTLLIIGIILNFSNYVNRLTLDFLGVTVRLFQSLSKISSSLNQVVNSQVHIAEFMALEKKTVIKNPNYFSIVNSNKLNLEKVNFKYVNSDIYIFENLNLEITRHTHNIIVGANGSGKSTLLGLIGNVLRPESGNLNSFSQKFAYIGATPYIFPTTLKENLLYGNNNKVSTSEIEYFLKKFKVFNEENNDQLNKLIDNTSLSSGQMQKIAFIRALLADPDILLLDEAMSNLDEDSKKLFLSIISKQEITVINSTHDPEKYEKIDSIISINTVDEKRVLSITN